MSDVVSASKIFISLTIAHDIKFVISTIVEILELSAQPSTLW